MSDDVRDGTGLTPEPPTRTFACGVAALPLLDVTSGELSSPRDLFREVPDVAGDDEDSMGDDAVRTPSPVVRLRLGLASFDGVRSTRSVRVWLSQRRTTGSSLKPEGDVKDDVQISLADRVTTSFGTGNESAADASQGELTHTSDSKRCHSEKVQQMAVRR